MQSQEPDLQRPYFRASCEAIEYTHATKNNPRPKLRGAQNTLTRAVLPGYARK
jgi:hypothetical protein